MANVKQGFDVASPLTANAAKALKAAGMEFVGRYINGSWKRMVPAEAAIIASAGLKIFSIYQTTAKMALGSDGNKHGEAATKLAIALDQPAGSTIYFAVDFDANIGDFPTIKKFFKDVRNTMGTNYKLGIYGSFSTMMDAEIYKYAEKFFQTYAWSDGKLYSKYHVYQYRNGVEISGIEVDKCQGDLDTMGLWVPGKVVPEKPVAPDWKQAGIDYLESIGVITDGVWKKDSAVDMGTLGVILANMQEWLDTRK
jgi:hypothetical protein